jgi:hypothetical protein
MRKPFPRTTIPKFGQVAWVSFAYFAAFVTFFYLSTIEQVVNAYTKDPVVYKAVFLMAWAYTITVGALGWTFIGLAVHWLHAKMYWQMLPADKVTWTQMEGKVLRSEFAHRLLWMRPHEATFIPDGATLEESLVVLYSEKIPTDGVRGTIHMPSELPYSASFFFRFFEPKTEAVQKTDDQSNPESFRDAA